MPRRRRDSIESADPQQRTPLENACAYEENRQHGFRHTPHGLRQWQWIERTGHEITPPCSYCRRGGHTCYMNGQSVACSRCSRGQKHCEHHPADVLREYHRHGQERRQRREAVRNRRSNSPPRRRRETVQPEPALEPQPVEARPADPPRHDADFEALVAEEARRAADERRREDARREGERIAHRGRVQELERAREAAWEQAQALDEAVTRERDRHPEGDMDLDHVVRQTDRGEYYMTPRAPRTEPPRPANPFWTPAANARPHPATIERTDNLAARLRELDIVRPEARPPREPDPPRPGFGGGARRRSPATPTPRNRNRARTATPQPERPGPPRPPSVPPRPPTIIDMTRDTPTPPPRPNAPTPPPRPNENAGANRVDRRRPLTPPPTGVEGPLQQDAIGRRPASEGMPAWQGRAGLYTSLQRERINIERAVDREANPFNQYPAQEGETLRAYTLRLRGLLDEAERRHLDLQWTLIRTAPGDVEEWANYRRAYNVVHRLRIALNHALHGVQPPVWRGP